MLNKRKSDLLIRLVENYVSSAEPVPSSLLAKEFDLSSATIRNEMSELEDGGYIRQPHTSAGRIPTEEGFKFYIAQQFLKEKEPAVDVQNNLKNVWQSLSDPDQQIKFLAKKLAEVSHETVLIGFGESDVYYTGVSNLFSKPEFADFNVLMNFSKLMDHIDEVVSGLFDQVSEEKVQIMIGKENPFGQDCATIVTRFSTDHGHGLIGLLGPMRMHYQDNLGLVNFFKSLIEGQND